MQSTRSLGLSAARAHCWLIFNLLCIRNLRSFLASLLTDCAVIGLFHPRYRTNFPFFGLCEVLVRPVLHLFLQADSAAHWPLSAAWSELSSSLRLQCPILSFLASLSWRACFCLLQYSRHTSCASIFLDFNEILALELCTGFSFFLVLCHAMYIRCRGVWDEPTVTWLSKEKLWEPLSSYSITTWSISHSPCVITLGDNKLSPVYLV